MNITAETVKELRDRTGAGMMDCKRALAATNGDIEKALDDLRKQGLAKAASKSARKAAEGLIGKHADNTSVTFVEVNCETDFVCKTDDFQNFVKDITEYIVKTKPASLEALLAADFHGKKLEDYQKALVAKIGENLGVRRFITKTFDGKATKGITYIHAGSKIGVVVVFEDPAGKLTEEVGRDVAMHVAAMNPHFTRKEEVPADVIAREKDVYRAQMAAEKKPPQVLEKIIEGKVNKYFSEICLEDQIFVKDTTGKQSVNQMLKAVDPAIRIKEFVRYQVGEGVK